MNVFVLLNTKEDILKNVGNRAVLGHHWVFFIPTMVVNGAPKQPGYKLSSAYLPLCSAEQRHSYRFGTTWGWVNDDTIFIFGWTIPLIVVKCWTVQYRRSSQVESKALRCTAAFFPPLCSFFSSQCWALIVFVKYFNMYNTKSIYKCLLVRQM